MSERAAAPAPAARSRAQAWAPWGFAVAVLVVLLAPQPPMPVGVFYDDGIYLDLAKALLSGAGYHHLALPGAPAGVHYPPLYPLWLALWSLLRPGWLSLGVLAWLKLGNVLLAAASVVPWSRWGARRLALPWFVAGPAAAIAVLLVPARAVTSTLFSEPLAWLMLGLVYDLTDDTDGGRAPSTARTLAGAALAALLPLARTILLPVTLAVAWRLATEKGKPVAMRRREATLAAFLLLPALAWVAWTRQFAHEIPAAWIASYGSYGGMWRESVSGAGDLFALVGEQVAGVWRIARQVWGSAGAVPALALCGLGLWQLRGWRSVSLLGTLGYFAAVATWPMSPDRFLWGMLPLVTLLLVSSLRAIPRGTRGLSARRLAIVVVGLALPLERCREVNTRGYANAGWIVPQRLETQAYAPVVRWAATLPRDALILTANDPLVAQATGLHAAPLLSPDLREMRGAPPLRTAAERVTRSACAAGAGWMVVIDTLDEAGAAVAAVARDATSPVRLGQTVRLDGARAAVQFRCAR